MTSSSAAWTAFVVVLMFSLASDAVALQIRGESPRAKNAPGTRGVATRGVSGRTARTAPEPGDASGLPRSAGDSVGCPPASGGSTSGQAVRTWRDPWERALTHALRASSEGRVARTGSGSALSGRGRSGDGLAVDRAFVEQEVIPTLQRILRRGGNLSLLAPATLALGVAARGDVADFALRDVRRALQHDTSLVRMHAAYALGLLGEVDDLEALLHDTQAGRALVQRDTVLPDVRAAAAIGLGLAEAGSAGLAEIAADRDLPGGLRAAAIVALGATPADRASTQVAARLRDMFASKDEALEVRVAAASTLGHWAVLTALPELLAVLADETEAPWVREAAAPAIAAVGSLGQSPVRDELFGVARNAGPSNVRSAAWVAIAELAGRVRVGELSASAEAELFARLQSDGITRATDRPWIALALGRAVHAHPGRLRTTKDVFDRMYREAASEEVRVAVAVAALHAGDSDMIEPLLATVTSTRSATQLRGWSAAALALSGSGRARDAMFTLLRSPSLDGPLRVAFADALAPLDPERTRDALYLARRVSAERGPIDDALIRLHDGETAMRLLTDVDSTLGSVRDRGLAAARLAQLVGADWLLRLPQLPVDGPRIAALELLALPAR